MPWRAQPKTPADLLAPCTRTGHCYNCNADGPVKHVLLCKGVRADGVRCQNVSLLGQCSKMPDLRLARESDEGSSCLICGDSEKEIAAGVSPNVVTFGGCDCVMCLPCVINYVDNSVSSNAPLECTVREAPCTH